MLGRIGKSYPRMQLPRPRGAPAPLGRRYGMLGGVLIAVLCALGALGWLLFQ